MSIKKWAAAAAANIREIREIKPDKPDYDTVGGVPSMRQEAPTGDLSDDDWFEEPANPSGIPESGSNSTKTDPDDPTGMDHSFDKLNGSGVSGSGGGPSLEPYNHYHG